MAESFVLGFAVICDGVPDVRTVSPSEVGAIVNALYLLYGRIIYQGAPEAYIREEFERLRRPGDELRSVRIVVN